MTDTRTGSIYKIICSKSNAVYVGSTFNAPRTRMSQHKASYQSGTGLAIYTAFKHHGWESLKMIVIETYQVVDRRHLMMYETLWFNKLKAINKMTPFQPIRTQSKGKAERQWTQSKDKAERQWTAWYNGPQRKAWYRSPYKLPAGSEELLEIERDPRIIKVIGSYRMLTLQEIIDRDDEILRSRK